MSLQVLRTVAELQTWRAACAGSVGFVPTMGALHEGHGALISRACSENEACVVSIFVNPTQFNDANDLKNYPRVEEADLELCRTWNVTAVFIPRAEEIYADDFAYSVSEQQTSSVLCGPLRPGHFTGVLTVVMKLFNLVRPTRAYFGEKDYQQLKLIEGMVRAFHMPVEVVPCPTVREADGLAMSSRNRRLSAEDRERAAWIPRVLRTSADASSAALELERMGFKVDYVQDIWNRRFAAVFAGDVRLIDNVEV